MLLISDGDALQRIEAMARLMKSGDLCLWVSPQLMQRLKAFASKQSGLATEDVSVEVDDRTLIEWLEGKSCMEPSMHWEVGQLPDNGGIYKILLQGGQNEESIHDNQG